MMINKNDKRILELSKLVLDEGKIALNGFNCKCIKCIECPFSKDNNDNMLCGTDTIENYEIIAKEYIKNYEDEGEGNVNTKYIVGEKVKVKEDLEIDEMYNGVDFAEEMEEFKGEIVTISKAFKDDYCDIITDNYFIKEDFEEFYWTNDMFEKIDEDENSEDENLDNNIKEDIKYNEGEKVRVRKDLVVGKEYNDVLFIEEMKEYAGQVVTIESAFKDEDNIDNYFIEEDDNMFYWSNGMFEEIDKSTKYHIGDKLRVRDDLEIDETYERLYFNSDMAKFKNEIITIKDTFKSFGEDRYIIEEDEDVFLWSNGMFEEVTVEDAVESVPLKNEDKLRLENTLKFINDNNVDTVEGIIINYLINDNSVEGLEKAREWLDTLIEIKK